MRDKFGGTFAPPLSDEKLAEYKALIDAQPESVTKDALKILYRCCDAWWSVPESTGEGHPHPCGRGVMVDLDKPIAEALWDSIPWKEELDHFEVLAKEVQKGESERNSAKLSAWRSSVREFYLKRELTEEEYRFLRSPERQMLRDALAEISKGGDFATPYIKPLIELFWPNGSEEAIKTIRTKVAEVDKVVLRVTKENPEDAPIPKPEMEDVRIRDMMIHLLWHARELELDREPMTKDKL